MKKLENYTLQKFLDTFVNELKRENESREYNSTRKLNIPFIISTLYQSFKNNTDNYKGFIADLENYHEYNISINKSSNDYNGIIDVHIGLLNSWNDEDCYPNYDYQLCFSYDERNWGYCECTPDMEDYREDKQCCGHGCDASFCEFELHKVLHIAKDTWNGDKHDYWEFEDEFYANDKELADKKTEEDKARMIKELRDRIDADSKKLAELEGKE